MPVTGDFNKTLSMPGPSLSRSWKLHVPANYVAGTPMPLVIVLHGATGSANGIASQTGFHTLGDTQGFLTAYPNGTDQDATGKITTVGGFWNNFSGLTGNVAEKNSIDDVGFIKALIAEVRAGYTISSIYLAGLSAGGMLAYTLARMLPGTFKALGLVSTTCLPIAAGVTVPTYVPIPISHYQGTKDTVIPIIGGIATPGGTNYPAFADVFKSFIGQAVDLDFRQIKDMVHEWPSWATAPVWDFLKAHA